MDKSAYLNSQIACAMIEAMGMQESNRRSERNGVNGIYFKGDFDNLLDKYGLHHNSVITFLQE